MNSVTEGKPKIQDEHDTKTVDLESQGQPNLSNRLVSDGRRSKYGEGSS